MPAHNSSIADLKAVIANRAGLAKPTLFKVNFSLPPSIAMADGRDMSIMCQAASMPSKTITSTNYEGTQWYGFKIPMGYTYDDITLTFLLSNDYYPRNIFDKWIDLAIEPDSYRVRFVQDYASTIEILQLNSDGKAIYGVQLNSAWPVSQTPIELATDATDQVSKFKVTIAYLDYTVISLSQLKDQ